MALAIPVIGGMIAIVLDGNKPAQPIRFVDGMFWARA